MKTIANMETDSDDDDWPTTIVMTTKDGHRHFMQVSRKQWLEYTTGHELLGDHECGVRFRLENRAELLGMLAFLNWMNDRHIGWFKDYHVGLKIAKLVGNQHLVDLFTGLLLPCATSPPVT